MRQQGTALSTAATGLAYLLALGSDKMLSAYVPVVVALGAVGIGAGVCLWVRRCLPSRTVAIALAVVTVLGVLLYELAGLPGLDANHSALEPWALLVTSSVTLLLARKSPYAS